MKKAIYRFLVEHGIYIYTFNYGEIVTRATRFIKFRLTISVIYNKYRYKKSKRKNGLKRALSDFFRQIDEHNSHELKLVQSRIKCKAGCSNCCYIPVRVTDDESLYILDYCKLNDITIDQQSAHYQALAKQSLDLPREMRQCIFLDEKTNKCKIYPVRPLVCRSHFSQTDPKFCEWVGNKNTGMINLMIPKAEIKIMSIWNSNITGFLPAMILKNFKTVNSN
jgi:Fe-S-cluster containining protein